MRPVVVVVRALALAAATALVLAACAGGTDLDVPAGADASDSPDAGANLDADELADPLVEAGRRLAVERNCVSCHSADGTDGVGPTWRGLAGSVERLRDGSTVVVDRAYLVRSIDEPGVEIVDGFDVVPMPVIELSADEVDALVAYIESLGS
ncbi:MAG: cytochrome c [Actinomycetota bacterium]